MYTVMGVTGQVGSKVALSLLAQGKKVRAVVRSEEKGTVWAKQGCELAIASVDDAAALQRAFENSEAVFVMLPPIFDPATGFPEARTAIAALHKALSSAQPAKVVALSTIGGQVDRPNLLYQLHLLEEKLSTLSLPVCFVRPAWFMENASWDVAAAREAGIISSFLRPLDKPFPMVATLDVAQAIAEALVETWVGRRIVELEGPARVSPNEIAATFASLLGRAVSVQVVPRSDWESLFRSQGMTNPLPRMQMLDGFNEGWVAFEGGAARLSKGSTSLELVLRGLIEKARS